MARSQRPLPRPHGPSVQVGVWWLCGSRGGRHLGRWAKFVANEENPAVSSQDTAAPHPPTFRSLSPALSHRLLPVVNGQFSPAEQMGKLSLGGLSPPRSQPRSRFKPWFVAFRTRVLSKPSSLLSLELLHTLLGARGSEMDTGWERLSGSQTKPLLHNRKNVTIMGCSCLLLGASLPWGPGRAPRGFARQVGTVLPRPQTPAEGLSTHGEPAQVM